MNYKSKRHKGASHTFQAEIKESKLIIKNFLSSKKWNEEKYGLDFIEEYLNQETLYRRRKYLFDSNVNNLRKEQFIRDNYIIEANLDAIHAVIIEVLKLSGLYRETFQEKVEKVVKCNTSHKY